MVIILMLLAITLIGLCFYFTSKQKRKRIIVGTLVILIAIFSYPILVPVFGEWKTIEGVASLMVFNFMLLIGGIIVLVTGFFTKGEKTRG